MKYNKSHFTIDQQIEKIKSDGFIVKNEDQLRIILENLNYYKLKGYIYSIKKEYCDSFSEKNIDILEVIDTYNFDKKLRTFLFEILEKIEDSNENTFGSGKLHCCNSEKKEQKNK